MELKNKVVALTGAGSGIGQAIAFRLAEQGCHLALADIDAAALESTVLGLKDCQGTISQHPLDIADRKAVALFTDQVIEQHGSVDVLINNAGVALMESLEEVTYEDFEWLFGINFWGAVYAIKSFLPHLKKSHSAAIVNVLSVSGLIGFPVQSAYSASKFAIRGLSDSLSFELKDTSVNVSCVFPGGVRTNIVKNARYYKNPDDINGEADQAGCADRFEKALLSPDDAAKIIVAGIRKDKKRILVGVDAKLIGFLTRYMPWLGRVFVNTFANIGKAAK
ncbi:MAG: NAD(P)-dependent dehydrogenase (short-subunit alcohol dehydrogenase family) [Phenylobacterium sp.]